MIIDKNFVLDYFQEYIFGFMFNDIENCIKAKANFAVATLLMAYTEKIGSLTSGHLGLSGHSEKDFDECLKYFEFQGKPDYYKDFKIKYEENGKENEIGIYKAFRCGLIHQYFPKIPCITHNNSDSVDHVIDTDAGIGWIQHNGIKTLRFHTNAYYRDFKKAVDKIFRQIFVQDDPEITTGVEKSLKRIFDRKFLFT